MKAQSGKARQQGVASIEFVFIFSLIFMLFYGTVGYVIPLLLMSSYNEISAEAVRASILIPINQSEADYRAQVTDTVQAVIDESWLGPRSANWKDTCKGYSGYVDFESDKLSVCIAHNTPNQIIPPITLFDWTFPKLPSALTGEAKIQVR